MAAASFDVNYYCLSCREAFRGPPALLSNSDDVVECPTCNLDATVSLDDVEGETVEDKLAILEEAVRAARQQSASAHAPTPGEEAAAAALAAADEAVAESASL